MLTIYLAIHDLIGTWPRTILDMRMRMALVLIMAILAATANPWTAIPVLIMFTAILTHQSQARAVIFAILTPVGALATCQVGGTWIECGQGAAAILVLYILCEVVCALDAFLKEVE